MTVVAPSELLNLGLPKWPQMLVSGESVSPAQALEIIRRTDSFFHSSFGGGNARQFNQRVREIVGMPPYPHDADGPIDWDQHERDAEAFRTRWGVIETEYVYNSWVSNAFIGGPTGWCCPDGTITFHHNVGKWPSLVDIVSEWDRIATAFLFLNLDVVLMSGEGSEDDIQGVVGIKVRGGTVTLVSADDPTLMVEFGQPKPFDMNRLVTKFMSNHALDSRARECYFGLDQFHEWARQVATRSGT